MVGRNTSSRAQADHYRQLALWTSDERAHHVLIEMARELEALEDGAMPPPGETELQALPRSFS
jgi:hypothetical protein